MVLFPVTSTMLVLLCLAACESHDAERPPQDSVHELSVEELNVRFVGKSTEEIRQAFGKPSRILEYLQTAGPRNATKDEVERWENSTVDVIWEYDRISVYFNMKSKVMGVYRRRTKDKKK